MTAVEHVLAVLLVLVGLCGTIVVNSVLSGGGERASVDSEAHPE